MSVTVRSMLYVNGEFRGDSWRQCQGRVHHFDKDDGELRRAQAALRESEARLQLLQTVWETDADGVIVTDSPSWRAYTGQTLEEWLDYGWLDAVHPEDREYAERRWREAVATQGIVDAEFRLRAPDGHWRWTNVRAAPVLDAEGKIEKWAGMNIDIDARKRAEQAVAESEARYRNLFETMGQGYVLAETVRDAEGRPIDMRLLEVNPAYERLMGISAEHARGRGAYEILSGVGRWWLETCDRIARAGKPERVEHQYGNDGRWFEAWVYPRGEDRYEVLFENITERKRAEQNLRQSEERQAFLLKLSDDLRATPSDRIIGRSLEMLADALRLDLCYVANVLLDEDRAELLQQLRRRSDMPAVPSTIRLSDYPQAFLQWQERTLVSEDIAHDSALTETDRQNIAAMGFGALIAAPVRRGTGKPIWTIVAVTRQARLWTASDVTLVEETAERTWAAFERSRAEAALRESEQRFRLAIEGSKIALYECDPDLRYTWIANPISGFAPSDILGRTDIELLGEEDARKLMDFKRRALAAEAPLEEELSGSPGGRPRWFLMRAERLCGAAGSVEGLRVLALDVTAIKNVEHALRQSEGRARLLLAELQHRVRNILAMIRSVARRTGETTETVEDYVQHLEGRISAMARTQALLTRDAGAMVDLQNLLLDELDMQAAQPDQYRLTGPDVSLSAKAAEVLGLALHELATNSVKYGALSSTDGRIDVRWAILDGDDAQQLSLIWSELGVSLSDRPRRQGFGTELITERVPYELHGSGTLEFRPTGLVATIEFPLVEMPSVLQTDEGIR